MKIDVNQILGKSFSFLKRQAPTILSILGSLGVVATGVLSAKGHKKYCQEWMKETTSLPSALSTRDLVKLKIKAYAPAVITGAASIACIIGANAVNHTQQASLMSAYCVLGNTFLDYQRHNKESFGNVNDTIIREEMAKDRYEDGIFDDKGVNTQCFYLDSYGYFESTVENVLIAEYRLNKKFQDEGWCNINDLHEYLGLEPVNGGEYQAWYSKGCRVNDEEPAFEGILDFLHDIVYLPDGLEVTMLTLATPASYGGYEWPF